MAQTLPRNLEGNPHSMFVILNYGSEDDLIAVLGPYLKSDHLAVYSYPTTEPFHMAHAKNIAHRLGILHGADVLVNLDADNYLGWGFEDFIEAKFSEHRDIFLWSGLVKGQGRKLRGVSGRIAETSHAFIKAGGYDEKYNTWAPDDKDFNARLCFLGYEPVEIPRCYLEAIPHGDGLRFREYPHVKETSDDAYEAPVGPITTGIANYGNFGCGEVFTLDGKRIVLKRIPTRVFGIGMHKTATTSLNEALKILGYESAHWESGAWARDVWDEMQATGRSQTLEKVYAACDFPISILYKELDKAYPGSKFILTIRDDVDWLRSVRDHFSYKNPHRWEWDVYPFSNRMHQAVYGRKDFDAFTMLERYRRHNAEIIEYFKNRPDELLIMREPNWIELCRFLEKPIPENVEYPRKFVTARM